MGVENIFQREHEIVKNVFNKLADIDRIHILADNISNRLPVFSFLLKIYTTT